MLKLRFMPHKYEMSESLKVIQAQIDYTTNTLSLQLEKKKNCYREKLEMLKKCRRRDRRG